MLNLDLTALLDSNKEIDKEVLREFLKQIQNYINNNTSQVSGGISKHNELTNLNYAASGHTGFQASLGFTPENINNKKTNLTDNSDTFYPSQKAVKTAVDTKQDALGYTPENVTNKSTDTSLGVSDELYPSQNAVKEYVDSSIGAIPGIESGSDWVRFPDGTQICWLNINVNDQAINSAYGSLYQGTRTWTYPKEFIATPSVTCSFFKWGTSASWGTVSTASTTSSTLRGIDVSSRATGTNTLIAAIAVGRWE